MLRGAYEQALSLNRQVREMQEKPADRLTSGLSVDAMLEVIGMGLKPGSEAFASAFKSNYAAKVEALPWAVVQDTLKSSKGSLEMYSENLLMGIIQAQMDPGVGVSGQLDFGAATAVVRFRHMLDYVLPLKDVTVEVLAAYIAANQVEKPDIWAERDVDLSGAKGLNEVVVAIWDSGVDMDIFVPKGKAWINSSEIPGDGIDNDGNGWVDDVHGFAHDLESRKSNDSLYPLPEDILVRYDSLIDMSKGLSDLQASVDSEEAAAFKRKMASLAPEEVEPFLLDLGYFGNYTHGTHVAGIAAAGNPAIRILNARISFDHKVIPDVPTLDGSLRSVRAARESIAYFKQAGVRVVNMSWGGTQAGIEAAFEANGVGDDAQMRAEMARIHFELYYDALVELMASAPEILFIPAAGNSDADVEFNKVIPSSIALPNVLVAGAVDQAGEETSFTSFGKNVRVHANGFEVESYLPGGKRQKFSGTSMSAPNVANLAAKLLAIDPTLSPTDLISLITLGAETSEDGRRHLIHPRKSLQMLLLRNGMELNGL
jgi:subtilisin family serine protease